jgi:hypothetical protein
VTRSCRCLCAFSCAASALEHHPDKKSWNKSAEEFKVAAEAYEVLSDPNKKANTINTVPSF